MGGFLPFSSTNKSNSVNFAGKQKVPAADKREVVMATLIPLVENIFDAFEKGQTVTNAHGQPVALENKNFFEDVFEKRTQGPHQYWVQKSKKDIVEGKSVKKLKELTAKLQNLNVQSSAETTPSIQRSTNVDPNAEQADRLNEFMGAHFTYQAQKTTENLEALKAASRNVQSAIGCPPGSRIPIPGQPGQFATLI